MLNKQQERLRILLHTDAAQALGKIHVDVQELGVDFLTIVGHKVRSSPHSLSRLFYNTIKILLTPFIPPQFYGPRIGALFVNGPGTETPLYPMLFGGGQERNFRPG